MASKTGWLLFLGLAFVLVLFREGASSEERIWTDSTGKSTVTAELVSSTAEQVVLRRTDGTEIKLPRKHLSDADQAFLNKSRRKNITGIRATREAITEIANQFYADLRTQQRDQARQCLTERAQKVIESGQSPLAMLPKPEDGKKAIRPGRVTLDGPLAEIAVRVSADGRMHKTKMHLRYEQDRWRVFAMSATYPDGEKSINFEASGSKKKANPLQTLLGQTLELEGYSIEGQRLDMSYFQGKVVLVDFWATWCGPCRAEIPNIQKNWEKHHDEGFEVIAISVDQDMQSLQKFVATEQPPWTVVADNHPQNKNSMGEKFGIRGIPAFILIGKDGKVAAVNCRGKKLEKQLARLL